MHSCSLSLSLMHSCSLHVTSPGRLNRVQNGVKINCFFLRSCKYDVQDGTDQSVLIQCLLLSHLICMYKEYISFLGTISVEAIKAGYTIVRIYQSLLVVSILLRLKKQPIYKSRHNLHTIYKTSMKAHGIMSFGYNCFVKD